MGGGEGVGMGGAGGGWEGGGGAGPGGVPYSAASVVVMS